MVELKHCPSNPNPAGDEDAPLYQRIKDHAVEFYEATPEEHMHCLRNTFNKVRVGDPQSDGRQAHSPELPTACQAEPGGHGARCPGRSSCPGCMSTQLDSAPNPLPQYMTKLSKATNGIVPAKQSELEVTVTKAGDGAPAGK